MCNKRYLLVLLMLVNLVACKKGITGGESYNDARKKAGLPIVPKEWKYFKDATSMSYWYRPSHGPTPPYTYYQKWIQADKDHLIKEENLFQGASYFSGKDSTDEELRVGAYFDKDKNVTRWDIAYKGPGYDMLRLTKQQADSILQNWGIKY